MAVSLYRPRTSNPQLLAGVAPTLFDSSLLGLEGSRQAWTYAERAYLNNPLPLTTRVALLSACWEGRGRSSPGLHMTGLPLLGQSQDLVDLERVWANMMLDPDHRCVLASTLRVGNGKDLPVNVQRQVRHALGPWTRAWQDLCMFAGWADRLHGVYAMDLSPLDDPRVEPWMAHVVRAIDVVAPLLPNRDAQN